MGTGSFLGVKSGRGVKLTTHPNLMLWSRKGRAIPLPPHGPYSMYRASVPVQGCTLPYPWCWLLQLAETCRGIKSSFVRQLEIKLVSVTYFNVDLLPGYAKFHWDLHYKYCRHIMLHSLQNSFLLLQSMICCNMFQTLYMAMFKQFTENYKENTQTQTAHILNKISCRLLLFILLKII